MRACICNVCGKALKNPRDLDFVNIHFRIGYGSKYDGDMIDMDICPECLDKMLIKYIPTFKINPLISGE